MIGIIADSWKYWIFKFFQAFCFNFLLGVILIDAYTPTEEDGFFEKHFFNFLMIMLNFFLFASKIFFIIKPIRIYMILQWTFFGFFVILAGLIYFGNLSSEFGFRAHFSSSLYLVWLFGALLSLICCSWSIS